MRPISRSAAARSLPAWVGGQLAQDQAGGDRACGQGCPQPQDVGPVRGDQRLAELAADQTPQFPRAGDRLEDVDALGGQIPDARHEPVAQNRRNGEDMVGEPAGVGVLLADVAAGFVHQQAVQDVRRFVDRRRDDLRGEGSEAVGHRGIRLEPGLATVFGIDQIHGLALSCGRKELAVARRGGSQTPECRHGQLGLCLDHHGEGTVDGFAFDLPARQPHQLPVVVGVGGLGHLADAEIDAFGQEHVEPADLVLAGRAGA